MDTFCSMSNSSGPEYKEVYTSDFNDFYQSNSRIIKVKKRKWNQSIYDNCYSEAPTKKVVSNELCFQQRPAETTTLSLFELDLSTLCPGYSTNETIHSKVGSNKNSSLNEQRPEGVLSLLGPLFTSGSEYPTKETFRKIIPPLSNECSIEETLALPELGMSPKRIHKTDLNLFNSDSTFSLNSKQHAKATLSCLNQVYPLTSNKLNREKYVEIDDPMDMTNYIEDEENFCF
ncbi:hypothetical protein RhiirA5_348441 [Rhizophagus irregularis]|uniref:Uncharacterized protein n=3 Tax=Rhizophagus irregularis TaxID=588596 RepID=U9SN13_RHIID|nr:hypothetical protein GLOIN_2v1683404 [Rhizophagus irregularis DAOM 181602=DAOM 197198]EXX64860.1 hypothetical protein RirG_138780 [Rhizophagus irregularis DAOM 197198w]PKC15920.1 hypothetical protein RhiirA5_348441 [Rhizophagus irregularis]PKC68886.1 hypothetical protein RhiirA1_416397 [Rhizophagus irregularis]PKY19984.1 hypothetical protein RhiirB3_407631 [Rhizophagus irregularis]POG63687.1 hypothetical protein GLOIN_2v1683404 [Rhizophagus irregularis DAOM 181602=DAOM 197198]|eukprot:XP_025170553.1 hypothetical protein GLOIN_2v1683404 [Rhizophagus irregularis DAOM 181602=DAOM 197198]